MLTASSAARVRIVLKNWSLPRQAKAFTGKLDVVSKSKRCSSTDQTPIRSMSCHNERVAKSRRHAEAKRSRSLKKSGSVRSPRPTPPPSSGHDQGHHDPSPLPSTAPTTSRARSPLSQQQKNLHTSPETDSYHSFPSSSGSASPRTNGSSAQVSRVAAGPQLNEISPPAPRNSFAPTEPLRTRTTSNSLSAGDGSSRPTRSPSPLSRSDYYQQTTAAPPRLPEKEASDPFSGVNSSRRFESLPHLDRIAAGINSSSSSKRSSLAPNKPDRAANRRSGFYGFPPQPTSPTPQSGFGSSTLLEDPDNENSLPDLAGLEKEAPSLSQATSPPKTGGSGGSAPPTPTKDGIVGPPRTDSVVTPSVNNPIPLRTTKGSGGSDTLSRTLSFYDPDLLLDTPRSPPMVPNRPNASALKPREPSTLLPREPSIDDDIDADQDLDIEPAGHGGIEMLAEREEISDDDFDVNGLASSEDDHEVSRRLRESLRQSQGGESASALDLSLVEKLLAELDLTKEKMKELQRDYSHMKVRKTQRLHFEHADLCFCRVAAYQQPVHGWDYKCSRFI